MFLTQSCNENLVWPKVQCAVCLAEHGHTGRLLKLYCLLCVPRMLTWTCKTSFTNTPVSLDQTASATILTLPCKQHKTHCRVPQPGHRSAAAHQLNSDLCSPGARPRCCARSPRLLLSVIQQSGYSRGGNQGSGCGASLLISLHAYDAETVVQQELATWA